MRKTVIILITLFAAAVPIAAFFALGNRLAQAAPTPMKIVSPVFSNGGTIPAKYTCDGSNAIPELNISDVPTGAKSLAVIVDDPDAPSGNFNHWVAWNITPDTKNIGNSNMPSGIINGKNSAGKNGYVGPCPPSGTHRYFFKIYALDEKVDLDQNAGKADLEKAMSGHILSQGELMGKYSRL